MAAASAPPNPFEAPAAHTVQIVRIACTICAPPTASNVVSSPSSSRLSETRTPAQNRPADTSWTTSDPASATNRMRSVAEQDLGADGLGGALAVGIAGLATQSEPGTEATPERRRACRQPHKQVRVGAAQTGASRAAARRVLGLCLGARAAGEQSRPVIRRTGPCSGGGVHAAPLQPASTEARTATPAALGGGGADHGPPHKHLVDACRGESANGGGRGGESESFRLDARRRPAARGPEPPALQAGRRPAGTPQPLHSAEARGAGSFPGPRRPVPWAS